MKINDVISEGPWDAVKGTVTGAISGAKAGMASPATAMPADIVKQSKTFMTAWQRHLQALTAGGIDMTNRETYQKQLLAWLSDFGFAGHRDFSSVGTLASTNPVDVAKFIQIAIAKDTSGQIPSNQPVAPTPDNGRRNRKQGAIAQFKARGEAPAGDPSVAAEPAASNVNYDIPTALRKSKSSVSTATTTPTAPVSTPTTTPTAPVSTPTTPTKFRSPEEVVAQLMATVPKDWLPSITSELLKRQTVSAARK